MHVAEDDVVHLDLLEPLQWLGHAASSCGGYVPQPRLQSLDIVRRGIRRHQDGYRLHDTHAHAHDEHQSRGDLRDGATLCVAEGGDHEYYRGKQQEHRTLREHQLLV